MVKRLLIFALLLSGSVTFSHAQSSTDKNFINETGNAMLDQWDRESYSNVVELLNQIMEYDNHAISQWGVECLKSMKSAITEPHHGISNGYVMMVRAANLTGHFKAVGDKWVKEGPAEDLQFSFTDKNGSPCVYRLYTEGATKTVYMPYEGDDEDDDWGGYDDDDDDWGGYDDDDDDIDTRIIDDIMNGVTLLSLEVPEHLYTTMTQGAKQILFASFDFDLSVLTTDWDPLVNGFIVSMNASFAKSNNSSANGQSFAPSSDGTFELGLNRVGYKPGTGINFSFYAKKEGSPIFSLDMNAPGTLNLEGGNLNLMDSGSLIGDLGFESMKLNVDMMGRIQANVSVDDLYEFYSALDELSYCESEAEANQIVSRISNKLNGNMYYNNGSDSKAKFSIAPFYDEEYEEWDYQPTITFTSDNSTYPVEEFFTEENFPFIGEARGIFEELMTIAYSMVDNIKQMNDDAITKVNKPTTSGATHNAGSVAEIYTISGKLCARTTIGSGSNAVISSLPKGIYILKSASGTSKFVKR